MSKTKREWMPLYSYLDRTAITTHLSDMAAKGWVLEKIGGWNWRYRRTEPQKLRFSLAFFPAASQFDSVPSEGLETYRDYCAAAGWQLAAESAQVQIFYTEDENAVPIETDPAVELSNIRRCVKKGFLGSYWALLVLSLFQILFQLCQIWTDPVETLSSTASRSTVLNWLPLDVLIIVERVRYYRWQRKAQAAAEAGSPLPDLRSIRWLGILVMVWAGVIVLWLLASYWQFRGMFLLMVGMLLYMGLLILLANGAKAAAKHLRAPRWVNIAATFGIIIALTVGGMAGMAALILRNSGSSWLAAHPPVETYEYRGMTWEVYQHNIPLRIEDLVDTDYDRWSTEARLDSTFLMTRGTYTQRPRMDELDQPDLEYEIVTVKAGFLYDLCKNDFISRVERNNDQLPEEYWDEYRLMDAPAWDAEEVYQRYHAGEPINQFLVCWPDRIIEVNFDFGWTVTEGMMSTAAGALKGGI